MPEFSSSGLKSVYLFSSQYVFIILIKINQNTINNNANLNNQIDTAINPSRLVMRNNSSSNIDCEMILLWKTKQIDNKDFLRVPVWCIQRDVLPHVEGLGQIISYYHSASHYCWLVIKTINVFLHLDNIMIKMLHENNNIMSS